jgi:tRNA (cytidine/uridine-2'-O-)-methyltransferase
MVLLAPLEVIGKPARAASHKTGVNCSPVSGFPLPGRLRKVNVATMQIALYQPDIAQNTGTILRLAACFGIETHIIEPAGFPVSDRAFRRAGMDYLDQVTITRHVSFAAFEDWRQAAGMKLVLLTTRATTSYLDHRFTGRDVLMFGRESAGVPDAAHAAADARLIVPMRAGLRSLNVAMACAMVVGEGLRQERVQAS